MSEHTLDKDFNGDEKTTVSWYACLVWGLGVFFYFYEFMLQTSTGVMVPDLMREFSATGEQIGTLSAFYLYGYAPMQIVAGLMMDKVGPRRLFTLACLFCAVGSLVFVYAAPSLSVACFGRLLMGVGGSFAVVGCMKVAVLWFPSERFALLAGIMVAVGMLGAAGGQAPMAALVQKFGWDTTLLGGSIVGFLLCPLMWILMKPQAGHDEVRPEDRALSFTAMLGSLSKVMRCRDSWTASVYAGLMFVPTLGFGGLWGIPFLAEAYGISRTNAALVISAIYLGWAVGGPIFGWLSDKIGRRKTPLYTATFGVLICMAMIWHVPDSLKQMTITLFFLGIFSSGFVLAFSVVRELNPPELTGTSMGFINTLNSLSGAVAQPLLGRMLDKQWTGELAEGARVYSLQAYQNALVGIVGCIVIAMFILPFIKETYCKSCYEAH